MTAREPTGLARPTAHFVDWAVSRGANRTALLARAGVSAAVLADPEGRVPVPAYYGVLEAAAEALRDPLAGLHYMESVSPDALGAIGFLASASPTLGNAFEQIFRYLRVLTQGERFWMEVRGGRAVFQCEAWGSARPAHGHVAEMYAFDCLVLAARMTGERVPVESFELRHARVGPDAEYLRIFAALPRFSAERNAWSVPVGVLARPLLRADAALARFLEPQVETLARTLPSSTALDDVRSVLAQQLARGDVSLGRVAGTLRSSPRTLQRRLHEAGTSLRALADEVRRDRSLALLDAGLALAEVSFLAGFSEPRAFFRAFRRWTGRSPKEWRERPRLS